MFANTLTINFMGGNLHPLVILHSVIIKAYEHLSLLILPIIGINYKLWNSLPELVGFCQKFIYLNTV